MQSGRQTVRQPLYFGRTRTPGHLILGVLAQFSGVVAYNTPVRPLTEALLTYYEVTVIIWSRAVVSLSISQILGK